jgi:hypothetical protein
MSYRNLVRLGASALILAGILIFTDWLLVVARIGIRREHTMVVGYTGSILLIFGLMGLYGCQIKASGIVGFLGFVLAILSNCFTLAQPWLLVSEQWLVLFKWLGILIAITGIPGYILLAIGTWRAGKLPRWSAVLWAVGYTISSASRMIVMPGTSINPLITIGRLLWIAGLMWAAIAMFSVKFEPSLAPETTD